MGTNRLNVAMSLRAQKDAADAHRSKTESPSSASSLRLIKKHSVGFNLERQCD